MVGIINTEQCSMYMYGLSKNEGWAPSLEKKKCYMRESACPFHYSVHNRFYTKGTDKKGLKTESALLAFGMKNRKHRCQCGERKSWIKQDNLVVTGNISGTSARLTLVLLLCNQGDTGQLDMHIIFSYFFFLFSSNDFVTLSCLLFSLLNI